MNKRKIVSIVVTGALALVGVLGAVTYRVVNAQSPTVTATPNSSTTTTNANPPGPGMGMHGQNYTEQELATALGIDLTKLQAAEQSATAEALKQAVAAGLITQSQADQFTQRSPNGEFFGDMPFLQGSTIDTNALLASALGVTTDQLQAARQTAYFAVIDQAVKAGTLTQAQADEAKGSFALNNNATFQAAMKSAYTAAVNQAVADGVITQAQADQVIATYHAAGQGGMGDMGGHGGRGGFGGPGGPGWGTAPGSSTTAPSTTPTTTP